MTIKEKIKDEIDKLPDEFLYQLQEYLNSIKKTSHRNVKIKSLHLKGQYDNINVRQKAYE